MSQFYLYLTLGLEHILDYKGLDHIMFIVVLCVSYSFNQWKKLLLLITTFTIGHSITLILAGFQLITISKNLIEFLIPLTILITALINIITTKTNGIFRNIKLRYFIVLFFGFIHGMGFSNYLRSLLGNSSSIFLELFSFNLGLEIGQIIIIIVFFVINTIMINIFGVSKRDWRLVICSSIASVSLLLMFESKFW